MTKAAVVIDDWKLGIFRRVLSEGGYTFTEHAGPGPHIITLKISTEDVTRLYEVLKRAAKEAEAAKMPGNATAH